MCLPGTIDNDIGCTSYTIGFDTALNTAIEAVDRLDDTMQSHERCSVVEVMGHKSGHLALRVSLAAGAIATLIPERKPNLPEAVARIRDSRLAGRTHFTVIVAEGVMDPRETARILYAETGVETRVTTLGHLQRGGTPGARDRVTAARMGYEAVRLLRSGQAGMVVCMQGDELTSTDIEAALKIKKAPEREIIDQLAFNL
jgi:6-phosphofructokinase 1